MKQTRNSTIIVARSTFLRAVVGCQFPSNSIWQPLGNGQSFAAAFFGAADVKKVRRTNFTRSARGEEKGMVSYLCQHWIPFVSGNGTAKDGFHLEIRSVKRKGKWQTNNKMMTVNFAALDRDGQKKGLEKGLNWEKSTSSSPSLVYEDSFTDRKIVS